jgi:hypothetical protein
VNMSKHLDGGTLGLMMWFSEPKFYNCIYANIKGS